MKVMSTCAATKPISCLKAQKRKLLDIFIKLKVVEIDEKKSKETAAHEHCRKISTDDSFD